MLVIGLAAAAIALVRRPLERRVIATGVFAVGALAYLLVRTDLFHTAPLAVMVAILGAWTLETRHFAAVARAGSRCVYAVAEGLDRRCARAARAHGGARPPGGRRRARAAAPGGGARGACVKRR